MRITCNAEVVNRLLPSFNMRGRNKPVRCQLSVGKKPGAKAEDSAYLMMCTKNDRNGAKYALQGNIEQAFMKFISEGKVTLRFSSPPHDVCISKADPVQLKSFMSVVRLGCKGGDLSKVTLASLAPASVRQVEKLQTRLSITSRRNYPVTTSFPSSLEVLQATQCNLKRVDSRILQLRNLRALDLSHNKLQSLPEDFDSVHNLAEIRLSDNLLTDIPSGFCCGRLSNTLCMLDLTGNKLKFLKPYFCQLKCLVSLKLDDNELLCFPPGLGHLGGLRTLTATGNQLKLLPATFSLLRLDVLDVSGNPFLEDGPASTKQRLGFPSLVECAARAIKKQKIVYQSEDIPGHLQQLLDQAKWCLCGNVCFHSFVHYLARLDLHSVATSVTSIDTAGRMHAPAEAFLCSQRCLIKYEKNPYASVWR